MKHNTRKLNYKTSKQWRYDFDYGYFCQYENFLDVGVVLPQLEDFLKSSQMYDRETYLAYRKNCFRSSAFCYGVAAAVWFERDCRERGII